MFGCDSSTVVFASATNLRTKASSVASSARICLTTSFFSKPPAPRRVAKNTRAMPPTARGRSRTYFPKIWGNNGSRLLEPSAQSDRPNLHSTRRSTWGTKPRASQSVDADLGHQCASLVGPAQSKGHVTGRALAALVRIIDVHVEQR